MTSPSPGARARKPRLIGQCRKPSGWFGRLLLWTMNRGHSRLTDWGLRYVTVGSHDVILDVGCGGGRTVGKLAAMATEGRVLGIDHSAASVATSRRTNREWIERGRVQITEASASALPFADGTFDLVIAVESHFWWPDLPLGAREVFRVLKSVGCFAIIAEFYNGGKHAGRAERLARMTGMAALTVDEHRAILEQAGFTHVEVFEDSARGWICATGRA